MSELPLYIWPTRQELTGIVLILTWNSADTNMHKRRRDCLEQRFRGWVLGVRFWSLGLRVYGLGFRV